MQRILLLALLACLATACGGPDADVLGRNVVATLDGKPILSADLDLYFRVNLLDPPEQEAMEGPPDEEEVNQVRSRLFDAFMEEQFLLAEAGRREIQVSEEEVEVQIERERVEGHGVTDLGLEARRSLARTRLRIHKLQEQITDEIALPTDDEVSAYAAQAEGLPTEGKRVLLRVLPFESAETAQKVHSDIRRNRTSFAEAAQEHETQPGQASPQEVDWTRLPAPVRDLLKSLKPGQVSAPLDHNGLIYLFQVQAWLEDADWLGRERLRVAREQLIHRNGVQATFALMQELRETSAIQIQTQHLGFRYVPQQGN